MKFLKSILEFVFYSNIFVGVCAVCLALTANFFQPKYVEPVVFIFIFCSTVGAYSLLKLFPVYLKNTVPNESGYTLWARNNFQFALSVLFTSLLLSLTCFLFFDSARKILVLLTSGITVLYAAPLFLKFTLRQIGILKPFVVALVWTLITALLPSHVNFTNPESLLNAVITCVPAFLFVLPLCIVYEVKDMKEDESAGLKTLPLIFSPKTTVRIALTVYALVFAFVFTLFYISKSDAFRLLMCFYIAPFLASAVAVAFVKETKHEFYYLGIIDGMMILQYLFLHFTLGTV